MRRVAFISFRLTAITFTLLVTGFAVAARAEQTTTAPSGEQSLQGVLVLPFAPLSPNSDADVAVSSVLQRSLVVDLSRSRQFHATVGEKVAAGEDEAIDLGKQAKARYAVSGTVQVAEGRVRATCEVWDIEQSDRAGQFRVAGSMRDLFELQDALAEQVLKRIQTAEPDDQNADAADTAESPRVEPSESLHIAEKLRTFNPDWLAPPTPLRDEVTYRYNYGYPPIGYYPSYYPYGCYSGFTTYYTRPYRPIYYGARVHGGYRYGGVMDRPLYYRYGHDHRRSFSGPVPLRWMYRR